MASAWAEEETFICSVCLETMKDPATVPCGHSYCLRCVQDHWDREKGKGRYTCPQCRQVFAPRPSLGRSTVLVEAMEKLRASFEQSASTFDSPTPPPPMPDYMEVLPGTGAPGEALGGEQGCTYPAPPCPQHQRPLDLYCREDRECVCEECRWCGHRGHCVLSPEEERREKQKELVQMQSDVHIRIQETEKDLKEISLAAPQHKASVQALQKESARLILELKKGLELMGTQVDELLSAHDASLGSRAECHIHRLEQRVAQLHRKSQKMDSLADMPDHICFLKSFHTMEPLAQTEGEESGLDQEHEVVSGIYSVMSELQNLVQDHFKDSLAKIFRLVNDVTAAPLANEETETVSEETSEAATVNAVHERPPSTTPPLPPRRPQASSTPPPRASSVASAPALPPLPPRSQASLMATAESMVLKPKTREDMLKYRCEPTMDPNTVFRHILLSEGGRKAMLRVENQSPADHPERFHFWRQVLCRDPLSGSPYYWEVEWTGLKMTIGVAYKEMERKTSDDQSRLGYNASSWSLYWSGTGFSFWCGGQETLLGSRKSHRVGVYLDQYSGALAFYRIANGHAHLIHWHQTQFTGPLYPGFRFGSGSGSSVRLCQLD